MFLHFPTSSTAGIFSSNVFPVWTRLSASADVGKVRAAPVTVEEKLRLEATMVKTARASCEN